MTALPAGEQQRESAEQADAQPPKDPDQVKLELLLATQFDRSPQAILRAWNHRDEPPKPEPDPVEFAGTVSNYFEGFVVIEMAEATSETPFKVEQRLTLIHDREELGPIKVLSIGGTTVTARFVDSKEDSSAAGETSNETGNDAGIEAGNETNQETPDETDEANGEADSDDDGEIANDGTTTGDATNDEPASNEEPTANEGVSDENAPDDPIPAKSGPHELPVGTEVVLSPVAEKPAEPTPAQLAQKSVEAFARDVTLGNWPNVKSFLSELKTKDAGQVYLHLLQSLAIGAPPVPENVPPHIAAQMARQAQAEGQAMPTSFLTADDITALIDAAPVPIKFSAKPSATTAGESDAPGQDDASGSPDESAPTGQPVAIASSNLQLPPGVSIDQLPPEVLAELQRRGAVPGGEANAASNDGSQYIDALAGLVSLARSSGHDFAAFTEKLHAGIGDFGGEETGKRLAAASLLLKSGLIDQVERFLPDVAVAEKDASLDALRLWSDLALKQYTAKRVARWLEIAWRTNQSIITLPKVDAAAKDLAMTRLVELAPQVDKDLGATWLNASFTDDAGRGIQVLTILGGKSAENAAMPAQIAGVERLKLLRLQNNAVEKLLEVAPENAETWRDLLSLLMANWITETKTSIQYSTNSSRQSIMDIDMYGNYYWVGQDQYMQQYGGGEYPNPIEIGELLEIGPGPRWRAAIAESLKIAVDGAFAQLHMQINEEDKSFPFIESIAASHPDIARDLVHEFLRNWTRNHDPNTDRRQRNPYIYFYGFDQKAEAIPLTRSKQERNLRELAGWVERIRQMAIPDIDEKLLADAFTGCHSSAEVFGLDRVRAVFGDLAGLKPETVAVICQKMRANLAEQWRSIREQEEMQTNRREPEVQAEVLRGYSVALQLAAEALASKPDNWQLHLALACLMYDENAYSQSVQKSSEFSARRDEAFGQFQVAAEKYASVVATLEAKDQSTDVYDYWFYAGLGACDLGQITNESVPDLRQYALIRENIEALPGATAADHMTRFANNLFTRMSPIKPEIKFRYLRGGFEIVGDHPRAWEARSLFDYYKDLVSEIRLEVVIDGPADVGTNQSFGLYVNIAHTSEIERESGGFGKYVQNQNSQMYAYNYGRPTEDYRDKFNDSVQQALGEHFEVQSITFDSPENMVSRPGSQPGWRVTPYAYVLLKPGGPEVDRIAPLKLDLDFLDTSGYVVIPVESPAVVIDASKSAPSLRPVSEVHVIQTLDERQADEGRLIVEVAASGKGLVPGLDQLIDVRRDGFEVVSIDDQGVLPSRFDPDSTDIQILSDRSWTVEYRAADAETPSATFAFGESVLPDARLKFQRYEDADLVETAAVVPLVKRYASGGWHWAVWLIPLAFLGLIAVAIGVVVARRPRIVETPRFRLPDEINPFTVLSLLKSIRDNNGFNGSQAGELDQSINRVEQYWFSASNGHEPPEDLSRLAETWVKQAK